MTQHDGLDRYYQLLADEKLRSRPGNLRFYNNYIFDGVPLRDKTVLDVGAGQGFASFHAACCGAKKVVAIEPETAGATEGSSRAMDTIAGKLGLTNFESQPLTFQQFESAPESFDVILLENSINHLDEEACIRLLDDPQAQATYDGLFEKIARLMRPGGTLVITDCARKNAFAMVGLKSPVAKSIEWHKHQSPATWSKMLERRGFTNPRIRWSTLSTLRGPGRILFGNRVASFFSLSHFCLTMRFDSRQST